MKELLFYLGWSAVAVSAFYGVYYSFKNRPEFRAVLKLFRIGIIVTFIAVLTSYGFSFATPAVESDLWAIISMQTFGWGWFVVPGSYMFIAAAIGMCIGRLFWRARD